MCLLSVKNLLSKYSLNALKFGTRLFHKPKARNSKSFSFIFDDFFLMLDTILTNCLLNFEFADVFILN